MRHVDGDEADSGLDEAARHEGVMSPGTATVAVACLRVLLVHVEGAAGARAEEDLEGGGVVLVHRAHRAALVDAAVEAVELLEEGGAFVHPVALAGDGIEEGRLLDRGLEVGGEILLLQVHLEGIVGPAEVGRPW